MATHSFVSSPESALSTTTANYDNASQKFKPAKRPNLPAQAENPPSTPQPNWDVLATFALDSQQSISASSRSPSRARYSLGARIAEPESKDRNPLLSPILLDSFSDPVRPRSSARYFQSHAPSSSLREHKHSSSQFTVQRSASDQLRQSHPDHESDITFSADEFQTRTSSEIIPERGLCSMPDSTHRSEILRFNHPQRNLAYGERSNMPKQKSLHRGTGSRQLRRKASWSTGNGDASPGVRRNSNDFRAPRLPLFCKVNLTNFSPLQSKSRLETSKSDSGENIKQAYITTVTSPSRPQIISITRRPFSLQDTTSFQYESRSVSNPFPVTPPETPARDQTVRNGIRKELEPERTHAIRGNPSDKIKVHVTPPNSPFSSYRITESHQSGVSYESSKRSTPATLRHQPLDWILHELELAAANFPRLRLQLNSPVIHLLRLPNSDRLVTERPLGKALSPPGPPHSRYSIFRPLSSHPITPRSPQIPRDILIQNSNLAIFDPLHPDPLTDPTLCALQTIFPNAELPALESLQATYLALNYLSFTYPPSSTDPRLLSSSPGAEYPLKFSTVPPKARAMLGIQPPTSDTPPLSRFDSQKSEHGDDGMRQRIGDLVVRLRDMVDDLLGEIGERRQGICDHTVLTAVGEVIKMGEERRKRQRGQGVDCNI